MRVLKIAASKFDPFEHFKVDTILKSYFLAVNSDYRGRGIAIEMFRSRDPFLKSLGLQVTVAACTGILLNILLNVSPIFDYFKDWAPKLLQSELDMSVKSF
jgi:hypothetical protein